MHDWRRWMTWWGRRADALPPMEDEDDAAFDRLMREAETALLRLEVACSAQGLHLTSLPGPRVAGAMVTPTISRDAWQQYVARERRVILAKCALLVEAEDLLKERPDAV